jgi:hypothetical protein
MNMNMNLHLSVQNPIGAPPPQRSPTAETLVSLFAQHLTGSFDGTTLPGNKHMTRVCPQQLTNR